MWLIVGLGNPGAHYIGTRHNAGWMGMEKIFNALGGAPWTFEKKYNAQISTAHNGGEKILLLMPQTFMNMSGESVLAVTTFYKIQIDHIIVVHDDLDFPLGTIKTQFDRSAAGHNGVIDIIEKLGSQAFHRIRIGIGPKTIAGEDFVLQKFSDEELSTLQQPLDKIPECVTYIVAAAH